MVAAAHIQAKPIPFLRRRVRPPLPASYTWPQPRASTAGLDSSMLLPRNVQGSGLVPGDGELGASTTSAEPYLERPCKPILTAADDPWTSSREGHEVVHWFSVSAEPAVVPAACSRLRQSLFMACSYCECSHICSVPSWRSTLQTLCSVPENWVISQLLVVAPI